MDNEFDAQLFKARIVEFARKQYNMGHTYFEKHCGISPGTISAIKSNGPSASIVMRIATKCPELNLNWLFRGDGEMLTTCRQTISPGVNVENVQAVFVTNWGDIRAVVEDAVKSTLKGK